MNLEIILFGVVAIVLLFDFFLNGTTKKKTQYETSEIVNDSPNKKEQTFFQSFVYSFLISIVVPPIIYILKDYLVYKDLSKDNLKVLFEVFLFDGGFNDVIIYFFVSLSTILFVFNYKKLNKIKFTKYIADRKKNISLSIFMVITIKILLHYFIYPIRYGGNGFRKIIGVPDHLLGSRKDLGVHINEVFNQELHLFIISFLIIIFFSWYFNDKIKAR